MGLIELVLTVCAIAQPAACEEQHLQFASSISLAQCAMAAPPYIAAVDWRAPPVDARALALRIPGQERQRRLMRVEPSAKRDAFLRKIGTRPVVMGILNVTPDSFSDGGRHASLDAAVAHGKQMVADGCDIVDVGGESTRPGATPMSEADELARIRAGSGEAQQQL